MAHTKVAVSNAVSATCNCEALAFSESSWRLSSSNAVTIVDDRREKSEEGAEKIIEDRRENRE